MTKKQKTPPLIGPLSVAAELSKISRNCRKALEDLGRVANMGIVGTDHVEQLSPLFLNAGRGLIEAARLTENAEAFLSGVAAAAARSNRRLIDASTEKPRREFRVH